MNMRIDHKPCLVLNADYSPVAIVEWQRAIIWSYRLNHSTGGLSMDIIEYYKTDFIKGSSNQTPLPAVIKIRNYLKLHKHSVNFSRKNLFIRDNYTCQYCNKRCSQQELTYDHVIPKSQWPFRDKSPTTWTNIVTACTKCNLKKSNKTPQQAQMQLQNKPIRPFSNYRYLHVTSRLSIMKDKIPEEWKIYTG